MAIADLVAGQSKASRMPTSPSWASCWSLWCTFILSQRAWARDATEASGIRGEDGEVQTVKREMRD